MYLHKAYFFFLAVVSGGSDNLIRVWDWDKTINEWTHQSRPTRRGMINTVDYLSSRSDWYQGVGEIAVNGNLVACAPDASGPVLVFSLLTGSIVYELNINEKLQTSTEWATEDISAFTKLCLTPFFLLTKGKINQQYKSNVRLVPSASNVVTQRAFMKKSVGYITKLSESRQSPMEATGSMTPYQLYRYYQSNEAQEIEQDSVIVPTTSACINVWNLQTGDILYRLVPTLDQPNQNYSITDIRMTTDYSKVFATIEVRGSKHYEESLFCWDFSARNDQLDQDFDIIELDQIDPVKRKTGTSWVCFM